jgi:hypothetical protein
MQLQGGKPKSHNMKETKSSNHLWIDGWLDPHQNQEKCQMFDSDFMNNLQQALGDNLWPTKLTNRNYMTHLLCQT